MPLPNDEINAAVGNKIAILKGVEQKQRQLESRVNELALYADDSEELQRIDPSIIKATTARKNVQTMVRAATVAEYEAKLAEIDNSPASAIEHFNYSKLSDADRQAFRAIYKAAIVKDITDRKQEITNITGVSFE